MHHSASMSQQTKLTNIKRKTQNIVIIAVCYDNCNTEVSNTWSFVFLIMPIGTWVNFSRLGAYRKVSVYLCKYNVEPLRKMILLTWRSGKGVTGASFINFSVKGSSDFITISDRSIESYFDGSLQDCSNSSALAVELPQSSSEPSIFIFGCCHYN